MDAEGLARTFTGDFNNRSFRTNARSYVDPNIIVVDGGMGMQVEGFDAFLAYSDGWVKAMPDVYAEIVDAQVNGNSVILTIRGQGTFTGEMDTPDGAIPGNGNSIDMDFQQDFEIRNDKVVKFTLNYDMQEFMDQLGLG